MAILGFGTIVQNCLAAAQLLQEHGISVTVADARFCKPLDGDLIRKLAQEHEVLITVEEGSIGGFSAHVSHFLCLNGLLDGNLKVKTSLVMSISDNIIHYKMAFKFTKFLVFHVCSGGQWFFLTGILTMEHKMIRLKKLGSAQSILQALFCH